MRVGRQAAEDVLPSGERRDPTWAGSARRVGGQPRAGGSDEGHRVLAVVLHGAGAGAAPVGDGRLRVGDQLDGGPVTVTLAALDAAVDPRASIGRRDGEHVTALGIDQASGQRCRAGDELEVLVVEVDDGVDENRSAVVHSHLLQLSTALDGSYQPGRHRRARRRRNTCPHVSCGRVSARSQTGSDRMAVALTPADLPVSLRGQVRSGCANERLERGDEGAVIRLTRPSRQIVVAG